MHGGGLTGATTMTVSQDPPVMAQSLLSVLQYSLRLIMPPTASGPASPLGPCGPADPLYPIGPCGPAVTPCEEGRWVHKSHTHTYSTPVGTHTCMHSCTRTHHMRTHTPATPHTYQLTTSSVKDVFNSCSELENSFRRACSERRYQPQAMSHV